MKNRTTKGRNTGDETACDLEGLTEVSYNRLADGSRAEARRIKVDPETAKAILKAFPKEHK